MGALTKSTVVIGFRRNPIDGWEKVKRGTTRGRRGTAARNVTEHVVYVGEHWGDRPRRIGHPSSIGLKSMTFLPLSSPESPRGRNFDGLFPGD
jgi:hypothetical protein